MAYANDIQGPWVVGANNAPRYPGLYFVFAEVRFEKRRLLYIGESTNIASRMANHDRREDWEREARGQPLVFYASHIESKSERLRWEQKLIGEFSPPCNVKFASSTLSQGISLNMLPPATSGVSKGGSALGTSPLARLIQKNKAKSRSSAYGLPTSPGGGIRLGALPSVVPGTSKGGSASGTSPLARLIQKNKAKSRSSAYGLPMSSGGGIRLGALPPVVPGTSKGGSALGTSPLARLIQKNKAKSRSSAYGLPTSLGGGIRLGALPPV